jgi:hypothetical protein
MYKHDTKVIPVKEKWSAFLWVSKWSANGDDIFFETICPFIWTTPEKTVLNESQS